MRTAYIAGTGSYAPERILTNEDLRKLLDIKLFVATDSDDRLMRIIRRDVQERGRNYNDALVHYDKFVKPMHQQFIEPAKLTYFVHYLKKQ